MAFADVMHAYFRGEKLEAFGFILPIGVLLIGFAAVGGEIDNAKVTTGLRAGSV